MRLTFAAGMAVDLRLAVGARYNIALLIFFIGKQHGKDALVGSHIVDRILYLRNPQQFDHPSTRGTVLAELSDCILGSMCVRYGLCA